MTEPVVSAAEISALRKTIVKQQALVETLKPSSPAHRLAVELLLTFRDSLFVLEELASLAHDPDKIRPSGRW